jgi:hypothetical protein
VTRRWHDNRHTLITNLAESGAADETIRDIAGHVSKQMLKHYSHIRMAAKRGALEGIVAKPKADEARQPPHGPANPIIESDPIIESVEPRRARTQGRESGALGIRTPHQSVGFSARGLDQEPERGSAKTRNQGQSVRRYVACWRIQWHCDMPGRSRPHWWGGLRF